MGHRQHIPELITALSCLLAGCGGKADAPAVKLADDVPAALKRIEQELTTLRQGIPREHATATDEKRLDEVQAALLRIEGELITLRQGVPRDTDRKLKELQILLNDQKQWPQDAQGAESLRLQLDEIVQALSPVAAERILPELSRLNWGVEALWTLRTYVNADANQLDEAQAIIDEVLERQPRGHFEELQKQLKARLLEIGPQVRAFQIKLLLERAQRVLDGKEDASAAFSSLDEFREEKEVAAILPMLRAKVFQKSGLESLASFETKLNRTRSFGDERARQVSLLAIQEGILRLSVDLELEDTVPKDVLKRAKTLLAQCDKELVALGAKQLDDNAKRVRRYQSWALEQIRKFDSPDGWYYDVSLPRVESELKGFRDASKDAEWDAFQAFPSLKELVQEKVGVDLSDVKGAMLTADKRKKIYNEAAGTLGWKNNIHTEIAYRTTRDGMVKFLLPIQPQFLDPPVAQLYQQAFSKGWQKLEGRDDQLFVAQQSAVVQKKTLDDVASVSP